MSEKRYINNYPALSHVKGLAFRHFAGEEDYQIICDLWNEIRKFNLTEWVSTVEDTKQDEKWRKHFDINQQQIIVEMHGEPIGYFSWHWDMDKFDHQYNLHVGVDLMEEYWNTPIPQIMMEYQEEKAVAMTDHLTDLPRVLRTWCKKKAATMVDFYTSQGYSPSRYFFKLSRPIDKPVGEYPMPEGLEIRKAIPDHYRKIWDANQDAFRDHWGFTEPTEEMFESWKKEERWFQPHLWKVAWDGDEVAGLVGNFVDKVENEEFNRKRAYTEDISVGRKWRKRGLAKALLAESICMFQEMGEFDETTLSVDADNPSGALNLYTNMGYVEDLAQTSMVMSKKI